MSDERAGATWDAIRVRLESLSQAVGDVARDAAQLVGDVPTSDSSRRKLDPRRSQVAAAQFVATVEYTAGVLQRKAEQIETRGGKA